MIYPPLGWNMVNGSVYIPDDFFLYFDLTYLDMNKEDYNFIGILYLMKWYYKYSPLFFSSMNNFKELTAQIASDFGDHSFLRISSFNFLAILPSMEKRNFLFWFRMDLIFNFFRTSESGRFQNFYSF